MKFKGFKQLVSLFYAENGLEMTNVDRMHSKCRSTQLNRICNLLVDQA